MRKFFDIGEEQFKKLINEMGNDVFNFLENVRKSFKGEFNLIEEILSKFYFFRNEVFDIVIEFFVRYLLVVSDLCFIQSLIDVFYDFYRILCYVMEIERIVKIVGVEESEFIREGFELIVEVVKIVIEVFENFDEVLVGKFFEIDNRIDDFYIQLLENLKSLVFFLVEVFIMCYLERISDYVKEIGVWVVYVKEGKRV